MRCPQTFGGELNSSVSSSLNKVLTVDSTVSVSSRSVDVLEAVLMFPPPQCDECDVQEKRHARVGEPLRRLKAKAFEDKAKDERGWESAGT
eukprot:9078640-Pyramimonas_sp.AAC.1